MSVRTPTWTACALVSFVLAAPLLGSSAAAQSATAAPDKPKPRTATPSSQAPGTVAPALLEARRTLAAGDDARALDLATKYLAAHPASVDARVVAARAHLSRGDLSAAYEQLSRAVQIDSRNEDVLYYLGLVTGRFADATLGHLAETAPDFYRVHQLKAEALELQERRIDAEAEYELALKGQPASLEVLLALAKLKRIRLECESAIALYQRAEAVQPTFDGAYGLGVCYGYTQDDERAAVAFKQALGRDSRSAIAWSGLGTTLYRQGHAAEAIDALKRATVIEPKMVDAWYGLGRAYQQAGQAELSRQAFERAERLRAEPGADPDKPSTNDGQPRSMRPAPPAQEPH